MLKKYIQSQLGKYKIIFLLCLLSNALLAKNYYVSNTGKNSNDGSFEYPFRTIQFAVDHLKPGDKCYVRKGVYREKVIFSKSGTKQHPIFLQNYLQEEVTIAPQIVQRKWELFKKNIYRIPCKKKVYQLFIDGKPSMQASFPNVIEGDMNTTSWGDMTAYPNKTIVLKGLSKFKNLKNCHFVGLHTRGLVALNGDIIQQNGDQITLKNDAFYWDKKFINNYLGKGKGFVTGSLQFLDHPGEWFSDGNYLYFWPPNGKPDELEITIRENLYNLLVDDKSNITIDGINLFGCSFSAKNAENISFLNSSILFPSPFFHPKEGFSSIGGESIEISGKKNKIQNCYIAHSWGNGLTVSGENHIVSNCILYDCDWMAIDCAPLHISGKNHSVTHCTISRSARSAVLLANFEKGRISYNEISESGILCDDLGLLYCYFNDGKQTEISYNWFHDNHAPCIGAGIYLDNGHKNFNVHHNVVWNCFIAMIINEPCENDVISHNTFFQNKYSMSCWPPRKTGNLNIRTYNNLTDSKLKSNYNQDFHGSIKDSNFVCKDIYAHLGDPNDKLFYLKNKSTLIDKGIIYGTHFPYRGKSPDIGAYENGANYWVPGSTLKIKHLLYENSSFTEFDTEERSPITEFFYTLAFFILALYILSKWKFVQSTGLKTNTLFILFSIKILFGFILFWIYKYYYLNTNTADIFKYFEDAKVLHHSIFKNSSIDYLKFIFGFPVDSPCIQEALLHTKHWVTLADSQAFNDNQSIIKLHALTLLFSFGFFHIHTLFFCFISFIGCILLYKTFKFVFPTENRKIMIGIFLVPSVLFWSSGVLKESVLIFGIGLLLYHCYKIIHNLSKPLLSFVMIALGTYIIIVLKVYVIIAILPCIITWYLIIKLNFKKQFPVFLLVNILYIFALFNLHFLAPSLDFTENLISKQKDFINVAEEMHAQSKINIPAIDNGAISLVKNIPNALVNVFFQPKMDRISNPWLLFTFLENSLVLLLFVLLLFFCKKPTKKQRIPIWISLFYVLNLTLLIGWIVPITGAISRYKTPLLPFLIVPLLLCIDFKKIKKMYLDIVQKRKSTILKT